MPPLGAASAFLSSMKCLILSPQLPLSVLFYDQVCCPWQDITLPEREHDQIILFFNP